MKIRELGKINKFYFGYEDIARALSISLPSARVTASRYVRQGFLVRVKKNVYVLKEKWKVAGREEKFMIANLAQVPSYISLMTALDYFEITTQVQRDFFESVAVQRTKEISVNHTVFQYTKIDRKLYFGFTKQKGFFMATPEKAFLDAVYLMSFGRYNVDLASLVFSKLDIGALEHMSKKFPPKTQKLLEKHGYLKKA